MCLCRGPDRGLAAADAVAPGLMTLAVGAVVLGALYVGREVFLPVVLSVLLAFVIAPLVDLLRRLRIGRVRRSSQPWSWRSAS